MNFFNWREQLRWRFRESLGFVHYGSLHCRVQTRIQIPWLLYYVLCRTFHIAQTQTRIPTPYFCMGRESESVSESVSGNVKEPLLKIFPSVNTGEVPMQDLTKKHSVWRQNRSRNNRAKWWMNYLAMLHSGCKNTAKWHIQTGTGLIFSFSLISWL